MKNYLALVLGVSIIASPAFASRARLEALGENKGGSYYIQDSRNIFLNPAQIVKYKKKMMLEFGGQTTPATADTAASNAASRPQGGFTNTFGDFTYGLYLNNNSERAIGTVALANAAGLTAVGGGALTTFAAPDSTIEAFFAGEGGANWGISLFYAGNDTKGAGALANPTTSSLFGTRLGVEVSNFAIFASVGIITKSSLNNATATIAADELSGKIGVDGGITYTMDNMTLFGKVVLTGSDASSGNAVAKTTTELRNSEYGIGAGWKHDMTKSTTMFARVEGDMTNLKVGTTETKSFNVPISLAAESQAMSWLAVRGSIRHSLIGKEWQGTAHNDFGGLTTVSAGLGLTFGDVNIDGLVASNVAGPTAALSGAGAPGMGTGGTTASNWGFGDNMLSRIALTYNF